MLFCMSNGNEFFGSKGQIMAGRIIALDNIHILILRAGNVVLGKRDFLSVIKLTFNWGDFPGLFGELKGSLKSKNLFWFQSEKDTIMKESSERCNVAGFEIGGGQEEPRNMDNL